MPALTLGAGAYWRQLGQLPRLHLDNMFLEVDPTNAETGVSAFGRPGLGTFYEFTSDYSFFYVWRQSGVLDGDFIVFTWQSPNVKVWKITPAGVRTLIAQITTDPVRPQIAARQGDAVFVMGDGFLYYMTDSSIAPIGGPGIDDLYYQSVAIINSYYIATIKDTRRFYWIPPGETTVDPLNFAEAERTSDNIISAAVVGDELWFLKEDFEEVWQATGDADAPFQRFAGRAYSFGCRDRDSVLVVSGALIWVTADSRTVAAVGNPQVISNPALVEHFRKSTFFHAFTFSIDQHTLYGVRIDEATFVYDIDGPAQSQWAQWHTYGLDYWEIDACAQDSGSLIVASTTETSTLYKVELDRTNDHDRPIVREITAGIENNGPPVSCDSLSLRVAVGSAPVYTLDPLIEVCWSDDEGRTWGNWRQARLGKTGEYFTEVVFRSLGMIRRPGRLFRIRCSEDLPYRITSAHINEA